jgi:hypothetical protein
MAGKQRLPIPESAAMEEGLRGDAPAGAAVASHAAAAARVVLPAEVVERTKLHILDTLAAIVSGAVLEAGVAGQRYVASVKGTPVASVLGTRLRAPLVELVGTAAADDVSLATAAEVATKLGKRPVPVRDAPGFVVNRLLTRMTSTLMEALERGNTTEETDEAVLRLGLPMAPSVLLQMVGPRVAWHVLETMHAAYPDRFPLSETLRAIAEGTDPPPTGNEPASVEAITDAVLEALADETARILDEGVVGTAADVDTCLLLGAGFPFFLGGITRHLDDAGVSERVLGRRLADAASAVPA